jgi:tRNA 2-selenouridine synthase
MIKVITSIEDFLSLKEHLPLIDVRSPVEFDQGHIPNAINFPILDNENRKLVGTCYKQNGHEAAVILGYKLTGAHFYLIIKQAYKLFPNKKIIMHCYRGGLRSQIMANLLSTAGFEINLLQGGYKRFRNWILDKINEPIQLSVLGGYTGSGKTIILKQLAAKNIQVLDLEELANHRGSAFGSLGMPEQPTNEMFENLIGCQLQKLNPKNPIWIEDESSMIGRCKVPKPIYDGIRNNTIYFLEIDFEQRTQNILVDYGTFDKEILKATTLKLSKRLGDLRTREALEMLENNNMNEWAKAMLIYYDKTYLFGLSKRAPQTILKINTLFIENIKQ